MLTRRASFVLGALLGGASMTLWNAATSASAWVAPTQPAGAAKSSSKVVLENARVRVKDVTFAPGEKNPGMHTHEFAHVGIILTPGSLTFSEPGKPAETVKFDVGSVGFREANVTHQATNPGTSPMRVIEVELK
jgi:quercetin dioxygenase-like cupin family protein